MISKEILDAMQILKTASQLDPYRFYLDTLNDEIVRLDDKVTKWQNEYSERGNEIMGLENLVSQRDLRIKVLMDEIEICQMIENLKLREAGKYAK